MTPTNQDEENPATARGGSTSNNREEEDPATPSEGNTSKNQDEETPATAEVKNTDGNQDQDDPLPPSEDNASKDQDKENPEPANVGNDANNQEEGEEKGEFSSSGVSRRERLFIFGLVAAVLATVAAALGVILTLPLWSQNTSIQPVHDLSWGTLAISQDGQSVVIGKDLEGGRGAGRRDLEDYMIQVFRINGDKSSQIGKDINPIPDLHDLTLPFKLWYVSGHDIALSEDGKIMAVAASFKIYLYNLNRDEYPEECEDGTFEYGCEYSRVTVYTLDDKTSWTVRGEPMILLSGTYVGVPRLSLSKNGEVLAIGRSSFEKSTTKGYVSVHRWNGSAWDVVGDKIEGDSTAVGRSVSLNDDGTIVGVGSFDNGKFGVYQWNETKGWAILGNKIKGKEQIGAKVSLSGKGNRVAVSSNNGIYAGINKHNGFLQVFELKSGAWEQVGKDISDVVYSENGAGQGLVISGDGSTIAHGNAEAHMWAEDRISGGVRVFKYDGADWKGAGEIIADSAEDKDLSRVSLSYNGKRMAVGAPGNVRVFDFRK